MSELENLLSSAKGKVYEQKKSDILRDKLLKEQEKDISYYKSIEVTIKENKNIIKTCKLYLSKKRENTFEEIKEGIRIANAVIPEAQDYHLEINEKTASIVNTYNHDLYDAEGSAYASIVSFNIRSIVVENTNLLNFLILDEVLATLSPESSANFSKILPELAKRFLIILIEQKQEIFVSGVDKLYLVVKNGDISEVTIVKEILNV